MTDPTRQPVRLSWIRRTLRLGAHLLIILATTAVLGEAALRVYHALHPVYLFPTETYLHLKRPPHKVIYGHSLNELGCNDEAFRLEKTPGTLRVAAVGDSFAYGIVPYPDNYLTLLEKKLSSPERPVEVYNFGLMGAGVQDYVSVLWNEVLPYKPDVALVNFYLGNDYIDHAAPPSPYSFSFLGVALRFLWTLAFELKDTSSPAGVYCDDCKTLSDLEYLDLERNHSAIFLKEYAQFEEFHAYVMTRFRAMKALCDSHGVRLIVALLPFAVQADPALRAAVLEDYGERVRIRVGTTHTQPEDFDFDQPNRRLTEGLQSLGIPVVDLRDDFVEAGVSQRLYKPNDIHWNREGNRLAAEILARKLPPLWGLEPKAAEAPKIPY